MFAPSLTGMGDRAHVRPAGDPVVHLSTWIEDLAALVRTHDLHDVVLVGHSQGGMVTTAAATSLHDRIAELVYLDAPVPEDGECGIDLNPPGVPTPRAEDIDLTAALPARPVSPEDGYGPELAMWVNERLCATPIAPSFEPVVVGAEAAALPRRYVFFSRTPRTYPCWSTRLRLDERGVAYVELDADHDAPLTAPDAVTAALLAR